MVTPLKRTTGDGGVFQDNRKVEAKKTVPEKTTVIEKIANGAKFTANVLASLLFCLTGCSKQSSVGFQPNIEAPSPIQLPAMGQEAKVYFPPGSTIINSDANNATFKLPSPNSSAVFYGVYSPPAPPSTNTNVGGPVDISTGAGALVVEGQLRMFNLRSDGEIRIEANKISAASGQPLFWGGEEILLFTDVTLEVDKNNGNITNITKL